MRHSACMYTMTPDEHFLIDRHPTEKSIVIAAGFSRHGFKFAPIIGTILADLALERSTKEPAAFLSRKRFS